MAECIEIQMSKLADSPTEEGPELKESCREVSGTVELIDDIFDQMWLHPGITTSNGCIRFPQNCSERAEFFVSGLLNIRRNPDKLVQEHKNGPVIEIVCPVDIPDVEIEFENPELFYLLPIRNRVGLVAMTTAEIELSVFNGKVVLDFVRIISMEDLEIIHSGSLNTCWKRLALRKMFALKQKYDEKIKEAMSHFICKMINKILRTYDLKEGIVFLPLESDENVENTNRYYYEEISTS